MPECLQKAVSKMAMNKFMHSKNVYQTPPDFAKLAENFEEFGAIARTIILTNEFPFDSCTVSTCYSRLFHFSIDFILNFSIPIEYKRESKH